MRHLEDNLQIDIITTLKYYQSQYPELAFIHHSPNGGSRNIREASKFKRMGVRSGFPDLFLPVAKNGYHGFFIELKAGKNKQSATQLKWQEFVEKQDYKYEVFYDSDKAVKSILTYLN